MASPTPTRLTWRRRIEAAPRPAAPALDPLLAAGDRVSRAVDRDAPGGLLAGPAPDAPSRPRVGPGPTPRAQR